MMGVNWAHGLMRWQPHKSDAGESYGLSHVHPFRFDVALPEHQGKPARTVSIEVGFSMHVFTVDIKDAGADPEIYADHRERRAFDLGRYEWSKYLKEIIRGIEGRKCFFAKRESFLTLKLDGVPAGHEYRVFFTMRRKGADCVQMTVQSAYLACARLSPRGQKRQPIGFRVILSNSLEGKVCVRPPS